MNFALKNILKFGIIGLLAFFAIQILIKTDNNIILHKIIQNQFIDEVTLHSKVNVNYSFSKIKLEIKNLEITNSKTKQKIAEADTISFKMNFLNIFLNTPIIEEIKIQKPFLMFKSLKLKNISIKEGFSTNLNSSELIKYFNGTNFELNDGKLLLSNENSDFLWDINSIRKTSTENSIKFDIISHFANTPTNINFSFYRDMVKNSFLVVNYQNLPIFDFSKQYQNINLPIFNIFAKQKMPILINGSINLSFRSNGKIDNGKFLIRSGKIFTPEKNIQHTLKINDFDCEIDVLNNMEYILLKKFYVAFDDQTKISSTALLKQEKNFQNYFGNEISYFGLTYNVENIPISQTNTLWPNFYEDQVREWVVNNLSNGNILKGEGSFSFGKDFFTKGKLDPNDIKAKLEIENTSLTYYENFPSIKNIDGNILFTGEKLTAFAKNAKILNSNLKNTYIELPYNLHHIILKGGLNGPISDFNIFIPENSILALKKMNINLEEINSIAESIIDINIPIKSSLKGQDVKIDILTKAKDLILSKALSYFDFSTIDIHLINNEKGVLIKGKGITKDTSLALNFESNASNSEICTLDAKIDNKSLKALNLEKYIGLNKNDFIPLHFNINQDLIKMNADLKNTELDIIQLGAKKPKNTAGKLLANLVMQNGQLHSIENITFESLSDFAKGEIFIKDELVSKLNFYIRKLGNNKNININYLLTDKKPNLTITADIMDFSSTNFKDATAHNKNSNLESEINIRIKKALMKNNETFYNFLFDYDCNKQGIFNIFRLITNINDNAKLSLTLNQKDQSINVTTNNTASLFRAIGIYKNIANGSLEAVIQKTVDANKVFHFTGNVNINNFYLTKQSFFSQMLLSLTSTSFFSKFKENSLYIKQFSGKIDYSRQVLNLEGNLNGPSIKIFVNGSIDSKNNHINLKGNVVPSIYGFNSGIASIPIIGSILSGGSDAIISADYKIVGSLDEPKMSVNPFSLLPISYLKKIFTLSN